MLVISVLELFRKTYDGLVPAMLVVSFTGFLFQLAFLFRKDR